MKIYLPASMDLFHIGHLRAIRQCAKHGEVIVGLLSDEVIKNYKGGCVIPFSQRKEILEAIPEVSKVIKQNELNPIKYLKGMDFIASGDGWEEDELKAIKKANVRVLDIKYCKLQSTTNIKCVIYKSFIKKFAQVFKNNA
jgi:phosphoenolpyruvate phosphomutase